MTATDTDEKKLLADIEGLRTQFPQTQDLYREVCSAMFFRYGITPTANKLYQLVRKGSMSAPAEALSRFWDNLREKSRVTISHPDLPEQLKQAAGDLVATLWQSAQTMAEDHLAALRLEAKTKVDLAERNQNEANAARHQAELALAKAESDHADTRAALELARHDITALRATQAALASQLGDMRSELNLVREQHDTLKHTNGSLEARLQAALAEPPSIPIPRD